MAVVYIPTQMRELTHGVERIEVAGGSLRQVIAAIDADFPGLATRLVRDDALTPGLAVSIDGAFSTRGLSAKIGAASEVHFVPAIGGG